MSEQRSYKVFIPGHDAPITIQAERCEGPFAFGVAITFPLPHLPPNLLHLQTFTLPDLLRVANLKCHVGPPTTTSKRNPQGGSVYIGSTAAVQCRDGEVAQGSASGLRRQVLDGDVNKSDLKGDWNETPE